MDSVLGGSSDGLIWQAAVLTAVSLAVGVLGGFVGLALGTMRLPALLLMGIGVPTAGGTNILVSSISSLFGALRHLRERRVNFRLVLVMGVPAFVGAFIGGFSGGSLPETLLVLAAGLLVLWQGHGAQNYGARSFESSRRSKSRQWPRAVWRAACSSGRRYWIGGWVAGRSGRPDIGQCPPTSMNSHTQSRPQNSRRHQPFYRIHYGAAGLGRPCHPGPG